MRRRRLVLGLPGLVRLMRVRYITFQAKFCLCRGDDWSYSKCFLWSLLLRHSQAERPGNFRPMPCPGTAFDDPNLNTHGTE